MWNLWTGSRPWPFGLDVAADGIRMLQFQPANNKVAVCAGAQWKAPRSGESEERSQALAVRAVHEILREGGFLGSEAVTSIPVSEIRIETLRLPEVSADDLPDVLLRRARDLFDVDPQNHQITALRAGAVLMSKEFCHEWILLAVPNEICQRKIEFIEAAGLHALALQPEPLCLFDSIRRQHRRGSDRRSAQAVVHLSQASTLVVIAHAEHILLVKNIGYGGDRLTAVAADNLGLEFEEADLLRRQIQNDFAHRAHQTRPTMVTAEPSSPYAVFWAVHDALREEAEALVADVGLCLRYCSNTFGAPRIENLVLAGDGAWDPSILHLMKEQLDVRCEIASPLRAMDVSGCPLFGDRRNAMADWTLCAGLAGYGDSAVANMVQNASRLYETVLMNPEGAVA